MRNERSHLSSSKVVNNVADSVRRRRRDADQAQLVTKIAEIIKQKGITDASRTIVGMSQPKLSNLLRVSSVVASRPLDGLLTKTGATYRS
jgi:hypothetical protein